MESLQNTELEEVETSDSNVVRSEQWEKLKEGFVQYGFRSARREIERTECSFNRVVGTRVLCVLSACVVGLISLFGLLLGLLGERTIVSIKSRQSKWRRGEEGVERRRERTGEAGRGSGREALMERESSRNERTEI